MIPDFRQIAIEASGLQFNAIVAGPEDGDLVLFLHGFPQFADAWTEIMSSVAGAGFRAVAVDQRGYSPEARPKGVGEYAVPRLLQDVSGFADSLGCEQFHLVGHDWGALLAWKFAARNPSRLYSLTALSTPHPDAFFEAIRTDEDQKQRSKYIDFFKMPGNAAEGFFAANNYERLRAVYQGEVSEAAVQRNINRLAASGALTAVLNWYRALDVSMHTGSIFLPTMYVWSSRDHALGETAALQSKNYVEAQYRFERLDGVSHWLLDQVPDRISRLIVEHLSGHRSRLGGQKSAACVDMSSGTS